MLLKFTLTRKLIIILGLVAIMLVGIAIVLQPQKSPTKNVNLSQNPTTKIINSTYPDDSPEPFSLPPIGPDPFEQITSDDKNLGDLFKDEGSKPNAHALRFSILPLPDMRLTYFPQTAWMETPRPFRGVIVMQPYFPKPETAFVFKALLDGKEIGIVLENSELRKTVNLSLKNGERRLVTFETEKINEGVHTLAFMIFSEVDNTNPGASNRQIAKQVYKVFVGTTNPSQKIDFQDWNIGPSPFEALQNAIEINDGTLGEGIKLWNPEPFQPSAKVEYTIFLNNPENINREYCLIAFLDYQQIPILEGKSQSCGIVKGGQLGKVKSSFTAPSVLGNHYFQVIRFENPLIKKSYDEGNPPNLSSSSRVLISVK